MADFRIYDRVISTEDVWLLANRLSVSGSEAVATLLIDVDSDGLDDAIDPDPTKLDTDGDGLTDGQEVNTFGSSPSLADTDGDGANDKLEVDLGKSPTVANVYNRLINGSFEDGTVKPSPGGICRPTKITFPDGKLRPTIISPLSFGVRDSHQAAAVVQVVGTAMFWRS